MKRNIILMIIGIILIDSCYCANLRRIFRLKRAESDFILRSCLASAELIRKHRTNDPAQLAQESSSVPKIASASLILGNSKKDNSIKTFKNSIKLRNRSSARFLIAKNITDTPLRTVDIKTITKDIPKAFKKKDPLPELNRNSSARKLDTDTPIIVVKNL